MYNTNKTASQLDADLYIDFRIVVNVYIVLSLCVTGICGNILSIVVLHKDRVMKKTTSFLLKALAFADLMYLM